LSFKKLAKSPAFKEFGTIFHGSEETPISQPSDDFLKIVYRNIIHHGETRKIF